MTKPTFTRPRAFELVGGLAVLSLMAGLVLSRGGPRSSSADQPEPTSSVRFSATETPTLPADVERTRGAEAGSEPTGPERHTADMR